MIQIKLQGIVALGDGGTFTNLNQVLAHGYLEKHNKLLNLEEHKTYLHITSVQVMYLSHSHRVFLVNLKVVS